MKPQLQITRSPMHQYPSHVGIYGRAPCSSKLEITISSISWNINKYLIQSKTWWPWSTQTMRMRMMNSWWSFLWDRIDKQYADAHGSSVCHHFYFPQGLCDNVPILFVVLLFMVCKLIQSRIGFVSRGLFYDILWTRIVIFWEFFLV